MERLTDEQIIELVVNRAKEDLSFLKRLNKTAIKQRVLSETRSSRTEETRFLWIRCFENSETLSYGKELAKIWCGDMPMFHKYLDKFQADKKQNAKGKTCSFFVVSGKIKFT